MSYEDLFSFDGSKNIFEVCDESQPDALFNTNEVYVPEETTDVFDGLEIDCRSELSSISDSDSKASEPPEKPVRKQLIIGKHIKINEGGKHKFTCTICNCSFSRKQQVRYHDYCVTGKRPLKCDLCGKGFVKKSHLVYHVRTHTGESPYKCPICQKGFKQKTKLTRHEKTHESDSRLLCHFCNKSYSDKDSLRKHEQKHNKNVYSCPTCKKSYADKFTLTQHLAIHKSPNYVCDVCGKSFLRKNSLNVHKQIHEDNYPFECNSCQRTFRNRKELKHHSVVHDKNNPGHECDMCSITCGRRDNLLRHIRNCHLESCDNKVENSSKTSNSEKAISTEASNKSVSKKDIDELHKPNETELSVNNNGVNNLHINQEKTNARKHFSLKNVSIKPNKISNTKSNDFRKTKDFQALNKCENKRFVPKNKIKTTENLSNKDNNYTVIDVNKGQSLKSSNEKPWQFIEPETDSPSKSETLLFPQPDYKRSRVIAPTLDNCSGSANQTVSLDPTREESGFSYQIISNKHKSQFECFDENNRGVTQKISVIKHTDIFKAAVIEANMYREPVIKNMFPK